MGEAVLKSPKGSVIPLTVRCILCLIHDERTTEFLNEQELCMNHKKFSAGNRFWNGIKNSK